MSDLAFFDIIREFLGDLDAKHVSSEERENIFEKVQKSIEEIQKDIKPPTTPFKLDVGPPPPAVKAKLDKEKEKKVEEKKETSAPPAATETPPAATASSGSALIKAVNTAVEALGPTRQVWKSKFYGSAYGPIDIDQLYDSLVNIGVSKSLIVSKENLEKLVEPYLDKDYRLGMSSFIRFQTSIDK